VHYIPAADFKVGHPTEVLGFLGGDFPILHKVDQHILEYAAGLGFRTAALEHTRLRLGEGYAGRAASEQRVLHIPDFNQEKTSFLRSHHFESENFVTYYGVPLIAKGKNVLNVAS